MARGKRHTRRRAATRMRPLALPVLLVVIALVLGGVPGVIIGFLAFLLVVDRLLERVVSFTGWGRMEAEHRFTRLERQRRLTDLERRLRRQPPGGDRLAYLAEDSGLIALARRRRLGVQEIPIDSIAGTVDRRKAEAFDRDWRPPAWSKGRWTLMCMAAQGGTELPPIAVYRVGDQHYVIDGHHRVSVARSLGASGIDAEVTELSPPDG
jgi:hypothetical protein